MSTDYNYDEQGQFFPYFVLTITALFTVPVTYSALRPSKELASTGSPTYGDWSPPSDESACIEEARRKQKRQRRRLKRHVTALLGWLVMALMVYLILVTKRTVPKIWDPYEVLNLPRSSTEKEIKSHYRKLSITQHPDKRQPDESRNETVQTINDEWVEITKAFKTLTDEDIRNNYIQYGHPDGKQSFSIGIALPQFIVAEGNGKFVLLFYAALLGAVLPGLVGKWWYGTQRVTKEKILVSTAGKLFKGYREDLSEGGVIGVLSGGEEYHTILKGAGDASSTNTTEKIVLAENGTSLYLTSQDRDLMRSADDEDRRKTAAALWAYLGRLQLGDKALNQQKYEAALAASILNESFINMTPLFGNVQPLLSAIHTSQNLIQAIPPGGSPLLQLPHFTPRVARSVDASLGSKNTTVQALMALPESRRRDILMQSSLLAASEYVTAMKVASQLPYAHIERAFFKVIGERGLTPSSLIQFVVKLRLIPPGFGPIPPVKAADLEDPDPEEGDLEALHGRNEDAEPKIQPPLAWAPYFPADHAPQWRIFLADDKVGKIAVPPFSFNTFDKIFFTESNDGKGGINRKPTCNVQTLRMQFTAPPQVGEYHFVMHLVSDSYVGMDTSVPVVMKVEEPSKFEEVVEEEDDISEPEEDSLAGQMNALKTGGQPSKKAKKVVEESSDESDSEEEEEDSDTDTDTDTDEE